MTLTNLKEHAMGRPHGIFFAVTGFSRRGRGTSRVGESGADQPKTKGDNHGTDEDPS